MSFKIGDLVVLKSGGPIMTVTHPADNLSDVYTTWFGGRKLERGGFPPAALEMASKEASKPKS